MAAVSNGSKKEKPYVEVEGGRATVISYTDRVDYNMAIDVGGTPEECKHEQYPFNIVDAVRCDDSWNWITARQLAIVKSHLKYNEKNLILHQKMIRGCPVISIKFNPESSIAKINRYDKIKVLLNESILLPLSEIVLSYAAEPIVIKLRRNYYDNTQWHTLKTYITKKLFVPLTRGMGRVNNCTRISDMVFVETVAAAHTNFTFINENDGTWTVIVNCTDVTMTSISFTAVFAYA
jgi:hypothetical protein